MTTKLYELHGERVLEWAADGPPLASGRDGAALIGEALGARADTVVLPVSRLGAAFFELRTGLAGEVAQKCVNYRLRLVIVGDVARHLAASKSFRDFVHEANEGDQLWFVPDQAAFERRLAEARRG